MTYEIGVVAPNSKALFEKEPCDLLVELEMAFPGYGKEIFCVLTGKGSKDVTKVSKSIRRTQERRLASKGKLSQLVFHVSS